MITLLLIAILAAWGLWLALAFRRAREHAKRQQKIAAHIEAMETAARARDFERAILGIGK